MSYMNLKASKFRKILVCEDKINCVNVKTTFEVAVINQTAE